MSVTTPSTGVRATMFTSIAGLAALSWWALRSLPSTPDSGAPSSVHTDLSGTGVPPVSTDPSSSNARSPLAFDVSAFHAPLWVAPPAPPAPPPPTPAPPPRPPIKWQLLAVSRDDVGDYALLYDPDADTILRVRAGQTLGDRTIEEVSTASVHIRDGDGGAVKTLALRDDKPEGKP